MILLHSLLHRHLKATLLDAEGSGHCRRWTDFLKDFNNTIADGFLALVDHGFTDKLFPPTYSFRTLDEWLDHVETWHQQATDARATTDVGTIVLYELWNHLARSLTDLLRSARFTGRIPNSGGLLVFIAGLSRCLVIDYRIVGARPTFRIIARIHEPRSAFDFWGAIDHTDMAARNALKAILATGHKLVVHRGVLVHADQREDIGVFGPSIDTLVLAEILAQQVFESDAVDYKSAIDIGSGNGLFAAALAQHGKQLRELFAVDTSFPAIACTARNVFSTRRFEDVAPLPSTFFVAGPFQPDLLNRRFDLAVCNPPYIPIPPSMRTRTKGAVDYFQAVGGTELMLNVVGSADRLLNPGGRLFLMTSSLALNDALSRVPDRLIVSRPLAERGMEVLFDVEAVLNDPHWLSFLQESCGLTYRDGAYYHSLHPLCIQPA